MNTKISRRGFVAGTAALGGAALLPGMSAAQQKIVLRYGNAGAPNTLSNTFNAKLSETLSRKTNGAVSFEIFAGSLGGEQKLIDSMALGSLDVYNGAYTGTREFDILYSPYFFRDGAHAGRVMKGPIGTKASAVLQTRYRARLLGAGRLGGYNLMLKQPIKSLAELRGRKIRAPQIEGCIEGLKFFGAIPTPIPFNEIYLALQQGIVDGVLTALNPGVAGKFFEVCKYVVTNDFGIALDKQVISVAAWNRLSAAQQQALQSSFDELEVPDYYEVGVKLKDTDIATWRASQGADSIITLPGDTLASEVEPLNKKLADEVFGAGSWDTIKAA
jgi:TRAP-type C4-dicarboxylate transport system substrate-binding protein